MNYLIRKIIRRCPGHIMNAITKPEPAVTEGFHTRSQVGGICKKAGYQNVLLVTDSTLYGLQYHHAILDALREAGVGCAVFSNIQTEPTLAIVEKGIEAARKCSAECIIALGGGSVLDSSKMIAAGTPLRNHSAASLLHYFHFRKTLPIITIPSTAGTGAETTIAAIVQNTKGTKCPTVFTHLNITDILLDSELTIKMPANITAACGIDALSHGLEGLVSTIRYSDADRDKSLECVRLVMQNLSVLLDNPDNIDARQAMCRAAFYGGNAINMQLAGYVHAFAHSIGAKYHIPHGNAIAISLLPIMNFQKKSCLKPLAMTARHCGISTESDAPEIAADKLLNAVSKLIAMCNLPAKIKIPTSDIPELVRMIEADSISYTPPVVMKKSEIRNVLKNL